MLEAVPLGLVSPKPDDSKGDAERKRERAAKIDSEIVESWRHYLRGLWCSGLRFTESLNLWWDRDDKLCIDLTGKYPMLRIPAEHEKDHRDRVLPIVPEFAEFLRETPVDDRTGRVFNPRAMKVHAAYLTAQRVSVLGVKIGTAAIVKVNTDAKGKIKYASCHDLRRSFGERWALKVMPQVLMELMRHESIDTTMKYYVGRNDGQRAVFDRFR